MASKISTQSFCFHSFSFHFGGFKSVQPPVVSDDDYYEVIEEYGMQG